mmetsp:Transcript_44445/g.95845  ORF Transcript_44445/g.95845 Transcript_44445/m.95845 type:complete len:214 (+) Transcript_44445:195-836(+)
MLASMFVRLVLFLLKSLPAFLLLLAGDSLSSPPPPPPTSPSWAAFAASACCCALAAAAAAVASSTTFAIVARMGRSRPTPTNLLPSPEVPSSRAIAAFFSFLKAARSAAASCCGTSAEPAPLLRLARRTTARWCCAMLKPAVRTIDCQYSRASAVFGSPVRKSKRSERKLDQWSRPSNSSRSTINWSPKPFRPVPSPRSDHRGSCSLSSWSPR